MLLRHHLAQVASKSAVARQLGISRDTVCRWVRSDNLDRDLETMPVHYGPRRPVPRKLDDDEGIIETRLAAYPESAVRLLTEIRAAGYDGCYTGAESVGAPDHHDSKCGAPQTIVNVLDGPRRRRTSRAPLRWGSPVRPRVPR